MPGGRRLRHVPRQHRLGHKGPLLRQGRQARQVRGGGRQRGLAAPAGKGVAASTLLLLLLLAPLLLGGRARRRLLLPLPPLLGLQQLRSVQQLLRVHSAEQMHEELHKHRCLGTERALQEQDGAAAGGFSRLSYILALPLRHHLSMPFLLSAQQATTTSQKRTCESHPPHTPPRARKCTCCECWASSSSRSITLSPNRRSSRPVWMRREACLEAPAAPPPAAAAGGASGMATRFLRQAGEAAG